MKHQAGKLATTIVLFGLSTLATPVVHSATVNGQIGSDSEYQWNTTTAANPKWNTRGGFRETNDGSGGDPWDINYLGTDVKDGDFQVGVVGGSILRGSNSYRDTTLTLSDIAINVVVGGEQSTDPAASSSGWDYALRLMGIDDTGNASFSLFSLTDEVGDTVGSWKGSGINASSANYDHQPYSYGTTETFQMLDGHLVATDITGKYTPNTGDDGVLEVSFDLALLSLFTEATGGKIITYLTMSCANDEAFVEATVSPVPLPSAVWLFGSALLGFIGVSRRTRV